VEIKKGRCATVDFEHERRLTEVESRSKSNTRRLDEMEKRQDNLDDLVGTVKVLADREARVEKDVSEIKENVQEIKEKPGKRLEGIVDKVILTMAAAVIGYFLSKIGL
jgi:predicted  nucleic acid-binding Zn-ribbon protein